KNSTTKGVSSKEEQWKYDDSELKVGDIVAIENQTSFGEVSAIRGKKIEVISNSVKLTIDRAKLQKTNKKSIPATNKRSKETRYESVYDSINQLRAVFSPKIDLRGKRAEEAIEILRKYIDDAQLLGEKELQILHGKGNGILKTLIREYLRGNSDVRTFYAEHVERGGDGITIVVLR
ncbi:Smr/MutS family protein, partial [Bacteroidales bacterium OttesenSCG-928-C19]|nr:Smr/MutS family protein [Bacteroidales bacterium OttesenSCG-928-C19]